MTGGTPVNKKFVYSLSNHGFLLVEHLIGLVITALLTLLILRLFPLIKTYQTDLDRVSHEEITTLRARLQKEAQHALRFDISGEKLTLYLESGKQSTYFISNHRLMRQVDGKGGEVALYHCDQLDITQHHDQSVTLTLRTKNNSYSIYLTSHRFPLHPLNEDQVDETEVPVDEPKGDDSSLNTHDELNDRPSPASPLLSN